MVIWKSRHRIHFCSFVFLTDGWMDVIIWPLILSTLSVPEEDYSRNVLCAIMLISTILLLSLGDTSAGGPREYHASTLTWFNSYIIMWSCPGNMPKYYPGPRDILPSPDKTTLISLLYRVSNSPGNMPNYYSTTYHYRNLHEV